MVSDDRILGLRQRNVVLILVVMEDGLRLAMLESTASTGLNPCCNGRWSQTKALKQCFPNFTVLILVVMEDGLRLKRKK